MIPQNSSQVIIYGNKNVGKSSILRYWGCTEIKHNMWELDSKHYLITESKSIQIIEKAKQINIYKEVGSNLSILVYVFDKSDITSFYRLYNDLNILAEHEIRCDAIIMLGHKSDTKSYDDQHIDLLYDFIGNMPYFNKIHISYFPTSINTGENLGIVFKYLVELSKSISSVS